MCNGLLVHRRLQSPREVSQIVIPLISPYFSQRVESGGIVRAFSFQIIYYLVLLSSICHCIVTSQNQPALAQHVFHEFTHACCIFCTVRNVCHLDFVYSFRHFPRVHVFNPILRIIAQSTHICLQLGWARLENDYFIIFDMIKVFQNWIPGLWFQQKVVFILLNTFAQHVDQRRSIMRSVIMCRLPPCITYHLAAPAAQRFRADGVNFFWIIELKSSVKWIFAMLRWIVSIALGIH